MKIKDTILHPIFFISLFILLLNDLVLKQAYGNFLTGKLSDFSGLIVFTIFIASIFPASKRSITIVTGFLFIIWKSPISTPFIDLTNQFFPFTIQRIIDYTDLWALAVLPLAHYLINQDRKLNSRNYYFLYAAKLSMVIVSLFAICATSVPPPMEMPRGTVYIGKSYTLKKSKEKIIELIKAAGYNVDYYETPEDSLSTRHYTRKFPYYQTDNIVIFDDYSQSIDTILNVKYTLTEPKENRTTIEIINVTLSEDGNIQRWQTLKYLRKQYKKIIEKELINKVEVH